MAQIIPSSSALRYLAACVRSNSSQSSSTFTTCHQSRTRSQILSTYFHPSRRRTYATALPQRRVDGQSPAQKSGRARPANEEIHREFILDEDIPTRQIQLKDTESGKLLPPQSLISLLSTLNRDTQVARALFVPPDSPAIVEIVEKSSLVDRLKAKEVAAIENAKAQRDSKPKQIELNWAISGNDLELKMKQLRQFVEKGKRVEILLAAKKRQRKASLEEAENVIKEIRKTVSEMEGCKEVKPMDGKIGSQALMVVQRSKT